jgi:hypothetical protein
VNWLLSVAVAGAIALSPGGSGGTQARPDSPTGANLTVTANYASVMFTAPKTYDWLITITNDVAEVIPGVELPIALPSQFSLASAQAPASDNTCGGTLALSAPGSVNLSGGATLATGICSFMIVVEAHQVGTYSFSTGQTQNGVDGSLGTPATIHVTVDAPPLPRGSFVPHIVAVGQTTSLEIQISNPKTNPSLFRGLALSETLLAGLAGPSATKTVCGGTLKLTAPNKIELTGAYLTPGTTCTFTLAIKATAAGTYIQHVNSLAVLGQTWTNTAAATLTVTGPSGAASPTASGPSASGSSASSTPAATPTDIGPSAAASPTASASTADSANPSSAPSGSGGSQPAPPTSLVVVILGLAAVFLLGGFLVWRFRVRS